MIDTVTQLIEAIIAYIVILLVAYLAYLAVTGPDTEFQLGLAIALLAIAYSLLHGKDALASAIRAWRGTDLIRPPNDDE